MAGLFWDAASDGSAVFFTDGNRLTSDASEGGPLDYAEEPSPTTGDLYRYDLENEELSDLSVDPTPGSDPPDVRGVLGIAEDGSAAYFAARGVLTGGEEGPRGEIAKAGQNNLYLWRQGEGVRFIAVLSGPGDWRSWRKSSSELTAAVSPSGGHLAFLSAASLTGYDNTAAGSSGSAAGSSGCQLPFEALQGPLACAEVYLYDATEETLVCASCNPGGARPVGASFLPGWSSPTDGPRYLSDDGERLFFESMDSLSLADLNQRRDVYEFETVGTGSCTTAAPTYSSESEGCVFLVSSGRSEDHSYLLDASSPAGTDVFFSTRERLVAGDSDERYDVYDARVGGGFPVLPPSPPCLGDACRPPASPPPVAPNASSSSFNGPGNAQAKPKKQKKKRQAKKRKGKRGGKKAPGKGKREARR